VLIGAAWLAAPPSAPPIYDGLEAPAEPYRHLLPAPALAGTRPPSPAHQAVPVSSGPGLRAAVSTEEQPPQAQLIVAPDTFEVPPGTTAVDITITPVPPAVAPDGRLDGNVYRLAVTARGTPLAIAPGRHATVVLRGPAGVAGPRLELLAGGRWSALETTTLSLTAADVYAANTAVLGDVALVVTPVPPPRAGGAPTGLRSAAAVGAVTVLGLVGFGLLRRRARRR
jgi:hypothetical protein